MAERSTVCCTRCSGSDVFGFERTPAGRTYYCYRCGLRWTLSVELDVLTTMGDSLGAPEWWITEARELADATRRRA
jgi:hypothetical protein